MIRVEVRPEMLRWARERAGFSVGTLTRHSLTLRPGSAARPDPR